MQVNWETIKAIATWPDIEFVDDREGCIFTVTVHRTTENSSVKSAVKILELLADTPEMTIPQLAKALGISTRAIEKQIAKLQKSNQLKRIGPAKGGHWAS
jgi:ATP-dependent DNA helicase RecG